PYVIADDLGLEAVQAAAEGDDFRRTHAFASISGSRCPLKLCCAGPVIKTWASSFQTTRSGPPSIMTSAARSARPRRTAATRAAHAPLPHAAVRPAPRSHTRARR